MRGGEIITEKEMKKKRGATSSMTTKQRPRVGGRERWSERGKKRKEVARGRWGGG